LRFLMEEEDVWMFTSREAKRVVCIYMCERAVDY